MKTPPPPAAVILVCAAAILMPACARPAAAPPQAAAGVIDLAAWDFGKDGSIELAGDWRFLRDEDDPACAAPEFDDTGWPLIRVPGFWDREMGSAEGYGWCRLRIKNLRAPGGGLGLYIRQMQTAGRLFVNGREIIRDGVPGTDRNTTVPFSAPHSAPIDLPPDGDTVVAWQIANFHNWHGGPRFSPVLGPAAPLAAALWAQDLREMLATGFILMMGAYSLILWFLRREEKASLFLAFLCLAIAVRIFSTGAFLQRLLPTLDLFDWRMRWETAATLGATGMFINFLRALFPDEFSRLAVRACSGAAIVLSLLLLALPCWITTRFTPVYTVVSIPYMVWILIAVVRAVRRQRSGARLVLAGTLIAVLTLLNDTLFILDPRFRTVQLLWLGLVAVIICYSSILSYRFARACQTAESLSNDLRAEVERQTLTISEQNRELGTLMRERTDTFINFNHDLKTPLTLMSNYLDKHIAGHGAGESLSIVRHNLEKLKRDVTNSFDLEKMMRAQPLYDHNRLTPLAEAVDDKIDFFRIAAEAKGISLARDGEPDLAVRIDPFALDRVLDNLLENSIRYTEAGGTVTVSCRRQPGGGGAIELGVEDTGAGIPKTHLKDIFKPYCQIRRAKSARSGLGMGLPIVKMILEEAGASIAAESAPGSGSRFTVTLPAGRRSRPVDTPVPRGPATSGPLEIHPRPEAWLPGKDMLLIIEDNLSMLASLQDMLEPEFNVACASSGREAIGKLSNIPEPALILSDIMMDDMDGYQVLDYLADSDRFRSVPLIFITARSLPEEKLAGLDRGAVDVIHKPFSPDELKAKIRSLVRSRKTGRAAVIREAHGRLEELLDDDAAERERFRRREEQYRRFRLTNREREIIPLLVQGLEYKEISAKLTISFNTVKPYVSEIYRKCGVKNRAELIGLFRTN